MAPPKPNGQGDHPRRILHEPAEGVLRNAVAEQIFRGA
jgi:hypothetical protein